MTTHTLATTPPAAPTRTTALAVTGAAIRRSTRTVLRSPALLLSPLAQSLFFLLVYNGQLGSVGATYLSGGSFIAFVLPLILLTAVATGAGSAGTLVFRDVTSGYLDRLRMAHGTTAPFLVGALVATLVGVALLLVAAVGGAMLFGYRPTTWAGTVSMLGVLLVLGVAVALVSIAVALRAASESTVNVVTLVVFGLSFFTGVFAPVDELSGWMGAIATVNPLTYVVDVARQLESGSALDAAPVAAVVLVTLVAAGLTACAVALDHARRNR
ncbi:ABC transporter permease [Nocardiaceae bacterium NPDC056970]